MALLNHIKSVHQGVKFSCNQCNYKARQKGHLLRHRKSMHEGVKFSCDQCNYDATKKNSLLTHMTLSTPGLVTWN